MKEHKALYEETTNRITALIYQLSDSYELLSRESSDLTELGYVIDSLMYANDQLKLHQLKIAEQQKRLISTSEER